MSTPIEQIKEKLDIVDFIRSYIPLHPSGKNFKALCPFHKEKTPSFMVSPERQTWHCFGSCAEGGDIFKFIMKHDNLEFYEALKVLAEKAGIELKRLSPADQKQFGILYDINKVAKEFFINQLAEPANKDALEYLKSRGLKKETIDEFEIGFTPNKYETLSLYLINLGYSAPDIERSGLVFKNERGNYTDRFRGRIMFPLNNSFGKTVGFSGRILPQYETTEVGKYINSPETPIFNKSKIIYGFDKTKKNIKEENSALLVEGQMDFLMCYQDGVKNIIAVSGTALTPEHLKTLQRMTDQLILSFDNDEAGFKAAERSIDLAGAMDLNVKILTLKDYKDPAEAVQRKPGLLLGLINKTKPAMEFYFERYLGESSKSNPPTGGQNSKFDLSEFKKNLRIVLGKIKNLASSIEKSHWLKNLSLKTGIEEKALTEEMEQLKIIPNSQFLISKQTLNSKSYILNSRIELIAQRLVTLTVEKKKFQKEIKEYFEYLPLDYQIIYKSLINKSHINEKRLSDSAELISLHSGFEPQDEEKTEKEFYELLKHLKFEFMKEKKQSLAKLIKEAEIAGDENKLKKALKEFDEISKIS
ncbi:MAG: DNA primase [Patescibacteria group bacterium]